MTLTVTLSKEEVAEILKDHLRGMLQFPSLEVTDFREHEECEDHWQAEFTLAGE